MHFNKAQLCAQFLTHAYPERAATTILIYRRRLQSAHMCPPFMHLLETASMCVDCCTPTNACCYYNCCCCCNCNALVIRHKIYFIHMTRINSPLGRATQRTTAPLIERTANNPRSARLSSCVASATAEYAHQMLMRLWNVRILAAAATLWRQL